MKRKDGVVLVKNCRCWFAWTDRVRAGQPFGDIKGLHRPYRTLFLTHSHPNQIDTYIFSVSIHIHNTFTVCLIIIIMAATFSPSTHCPSSSSAYSNNSSVINRIHQRASLSSIRPKRCRSRNLSISLSKAVHVQDG